MTKFHRPLLLIQSVAVGGTATVELPVGARYWTAWLHIQATGQVLNQIVDTFKLKIGTKVVREFTPDELVDELLSLGEDGSTRFSVQNNTAGSLISVPFFFFEPWRKSYAAQRAFVLPTGDLDQVKIEVKISATAHSSVTITGSAEFDNPQDGAGNLMPLGNQSFCKIYRDTADVNSTTPNWKGLERVDNLSSICFRDQYIDSVEFLVGSTVVREVTNAQAKAAIVAKGMTWDSDNFRIVFDDDDEPLSALPLDGQRQVIVRLVLSDGTPRDIPVVITRYGPLKTAI